MHNRLTLVGAVLMTLTACSDRPLPSKIAHIGGRASGAAFYMYRPGGTLDDYISLEIMQGGETLSVLSISRCSHAAARIREKVIEATLFASNFAGGVRLADVERSAAIHSPIIIIRSVSTAPSESDLRKLRQEGFTVTACKFAS